MPQQIVINKQFGGFNLSDEAIERLAKLKKWNLIKQQDEDRPFVDYYYNEVKDENMFSADLDLDRDDPDLVQVILELRERANGPHSTLKIVTIPEDVSWQIEEYDGVEWIAEKHQTWF